MKHSRAKYIQGLVSEGYPHRSTIKYSLHSALHQYFKNMSKLTKISSAKLKALTIYCKVSAAACHTISIEVK